MNQKRNILLLVTGLILLLVFAEALAEKANMRRSREFMRAKLTYSQNILEGLVMENYSQVITNGQKLWNMSKENLWQTLMTDEYRQYAINFQNHSISLMDAARDKKLDEAFEAYKQINQSCFDCHKHFRVVEHTKLRATK